MNYICYSVCVLQSDNIFFKSDISTNLDDRVVGSVAGRLQGHVGQSASVRNHNHFHTLAHLFTS